LERFFVVASTSNDVKFVQIFMKICSILFRFSVLFCVMHTSMRIYTHCICMFISTICTHILWMQFVTFAIVRKQWISSRNKGEFKHISRICEVMLSPRHTHTQLFHHLYKGMCMYTYREKRKVCNSFPLCPTLAPRSAHLSLVKKCFVCICIIIFLHYSLCSHSLIYFFVRSLSCSSSFCTQNGGFSAHSALPSRYVRTHTQTHSYDQSTVCM